MKLRTAVFMTNLLQKTLKSVLLVLFVLTLCLKPSSEYGESEMNRDLPEGLDFYSFPAVDIQDNIVSLEQYRGKVSLVVNVASQCGYTDNHYKALNLLQEIFSETNKFNVLAFPCDQFGHQEPGTLKDIYDFAVNHMGATFPLFAKINVLEQDIPPAWSYLMKHSGHVPTWNFWKYLVDHNGHVINAWGPTTGPEQLYQNIKDAIDRVDKEKQSKRKEKKKNGVKEEF